MTTTTIFLPTPAPSLSSFRGARGSHGWKSASVAMLLLIWRTYPGRRLANVLQQAARSLPSAIPGQWPANSGRRKPIPRKESEHAPASITASSSSARAGEFPTRFADPSAIESSPPFTGGFFKAKRGVELVHSTPHRRYYCRMSVTVFLLTGVRVEPLPCPVYARMLCSRSPGYRASKPSRTWRTKSSSRREGSK